MNESFSNLALYYNFNSDNLTGQSILDSEIFPGLSLKDELLDIQTGCSFEREYFKIGSGLISISVIIKCSPVFEEHNFQGGILVVEDLRILKGITDKGILKADHFEKIANKVNDLLLITDDIGRVKVCYGKQLKNLNYEIADNFQINDIFTASAKDDFDKYFEQVKIKRRSVKFNIEQIGRAHV